MHGHKKERERRQTEKRPQMEETKKEKNKELEEEERERNIQNKQVNCSDICYVHMIQSFVDTWQVHAYQNVLKIFY